MKTRPPARGALLVPFELAVPNRCENSGAAFAQQHPGARHRDLTASARKVGTALAALLLFAGCTTSRLPIIGRTPDLQVQAVRSIKTVTVRRIAVMPIVEAPGTDRAVAEGAGESLTAELYSQMSMAAGWEIVPDSDVADAMQKLPPTTAANLQQNAAQLGRVVSAEAVLYGTVERYRERVGLDYAAQSPASVAFSLYLLDVNLKQVIWTAKFDRTQKALTENVLNIVSFVKSSGRWVRAHEIALEGVKEAVADLHASLNLQPSVRRFEAGTYEEMKQGVERYHNAP